MSAILDIAKRVFEIESESILNLSNQLTSDFECAVEAIMQSQGRVIVCGMGKSGHIGKKMAATFASTGTPSFFVHPAEAFHGDLGMIKADDVFLSISNSGETDEVLKIIPFVKENGMKHICMVGNINSTLAKNADFVLNVHVEKEACPMQLAPTSSTTATLVMGDALAVALIEMKKFKEENFARFHPGGSLGRKLLTKVGDEMVTQNLPLVTKTAGIKDIIITATNGKVGTSVVVNDQMEIEGIITDGDLRRALNQFQEESFFSLTAEQIMTKNPKTVTPETKVSLAEEIMNQFKIKALLVQSNNKLVGIYSI